MPSGIINIAGSVVSQLVPVPRGRTFTIALRGTVGSLTSFKAQWFDGTNWNDFVTTPLSLSGAGEMTGTNVGVINEVLLVAIDNSETTNMTAVFNVVPIEAHSM